MQVVKSIQLILYLFLIQNLSYGAITYHRVAVMSVFYNPEKSFLAPQVWRHLNSLFLNLNSSTTLSFSFYFVIKFCLHNKTSLVLTVFIIKTIVSFILLNQFS